MKLTDVFLRRPVLAIVVNVLIIIAGLQAIRTLNVRQYPKLESATVTVRTVYVGASADLVRGFITTPLERAIAAADGIDYIESQSVQGLSTINVRLKLNFNAAERAGRHQRAREPGARRSAARGARCRPSRSSRPTRRSRRCTSASAPTSSQDNQVTDYLIRVVQPRLSAIAGVQRADILGGAHVRAARLAEARSHGGAERQPVAGAAGARRQQLPGRGRADQGRAASS